MCFRCSCAKRHKHTEINSVKSSEIVATFHKKLKTYLFEFIFHHVRRGKINYSVECCDVHELAVLVFRGSRSGTTRQC